jgi:hypothetical protein
MIYFSGAQMLVKFPKAFFYASSFSLEFHGIIQDDWNYSKTDAVIDSLGSSLMLLPLSLRPSYTGYSWKITFFM